MRIRVCLAIANLLIAGCAGTMQIDPFGNGKVDPDFEAWSAPLAEVSPLFNVRIPRFEAEGIPRSTALQKLESVWCAHSDGESLPVSFSAVPEKPERNICFSASGLRVRELLYIIAELSGATYVDGHLCGSIRVRNERGTTLSAPRSARFNHLFIFDGFKEEGTAPPRGDAYRR